MTDYKRRRYKDARFAYNAFIELYPFTLENLPGEIWCKLIEKYHMSNFGRLKSFCRNQVKIIKPQLIGQYLAFDICSNGKRRRCLAHRLVAELFIPNPENKPQVNHDDGNKFNNFVGNLIWSTQSENERHAVATGLKNSGEDNYLATLTNEQVRWIRSVYKPYDKEYGAVALAKRLNKSEQVIRLAVHGKHYKYA